MNSISVYLAGPIDDVSADEAKGWRAQIDEHGSSGVLFFSPAHAYFGAGPGTADSLDRINRAAISHCHAVIANLSGPGRAFGTIREIEYARHIGRPVIVVGEVVSLLAHDVILVSSFEEAMAKLIEMRGDQLDEQDSVSYFFRGLFG